MQEWISQLQGQVDQMTELVSRSCEASCLGGTQGLQKLAGLQTASAEQAQQVRSSTECAADCTQPLLTLTHHCSVVYMQPTCTGREYIGTHRMSRVQYQHFMLTVRMAKLEQLHDPLWHRYNA